jgi:uncharacterized protein (DUF433 family)
VVRTGQTVAGWSDEADAFRRSVEWTGEGSAEREPRFLRPVDGIAGVHIDPLRGFGEPVVRGVCTEVIGELVRAGESPDAIAEMYSLPKTSVDEAVRYELLRAG